jgi:hypothetical protein
MQIEKELYKKTSIFGYKNSRRGKTCDGQLTVHGEMLSWIRGREVI